MPDHPPICPNCDYDLSGEVSTWTSRCPTQGQCPECGISFEWSSVYELLAQWESEVEWYAEHATNWKQLLSRTPGTLFRLSTPWLFFKDINHRRMIRLKALALWITLLSILIHIPISVIGYPKFNDEAYGDMTLARSNGLWYGYPQEIALDSFNAILFPYTYFVYGHGRYQFAQIYWIGEWGFLSSLAAIGIGVTLAWICVTLLAFLLHSKWDHSWKLFARVSMLSIVPPLVYLQAVRLIHGYDYVMGKTEANLWLTYLYIASVVVMIIWQQLIWLHAIHKIWRFKPSWPINIVGIIGSTIAGPLIMLLFI